MSMTTFFITKIGFVAMKQVVLPTNFKIFAVYPLIENVQFLLNEILIAPVTVKKKQDELQQTDA